MFPWHDKIWQRLTVSVLKNRTAHALLFAGDPGIGKLQLAKNFAAFLLCENKDVNFSEGKVKCGNCVNCKLLAEESHPDFRLLEPEEGGSTIKIDDVRDLSDALSTTAKMGGFKVAILAPVEAMNLAASNALLKTLEEPDGKTVIMLVTSQDGALLPTIRSRCQKIVLNAPEIAVAKEWLQHEYSAASSLDIRQALALTANAPLRALTILQNDELKIRAEILNDLLQSIESKDFAEVTTKWISMDLQQIVNYLFGILNDVAKIRAGADLGFIVSDSQMTRLNNLNDYLIGEKLFAFYANLVQINRTLYSKIKLNQELVIDDLLLSILG